MGDLVLWTGIEPEPSALGSWNLSRWTTREVLMCCILIIFFFKTRIKAIPNFIWWPAPFEHSSASLVAQTVKESACSAEDLGSIPGLGRSPGGGNSYPLQYSCLENPMDRGAWQALVHGVTKSWTRLKWLTITLESTQHANGDNL